MVLGLKLDGGETFERCCSRKYAAARAGRPVRALHRRHQRGDERERRLLRRERGSARSSRSTATCRPRSCASAILREVAAFVGDAPQHDDMTMILLKVDECARWRAGTWGRDRDAEPRAGRHLPHAARTSRPASSAACSRRTASTSSLVVGICALGVPADRSTSWARSASRCRRARPTTRGASSTSHRDEAGGRVVRLRDEFERARARASATASATAACSSTR